MNDKYLDLARELKKLEHAGDNYTNCNWCFWNRKYRITKGPRGLGRRVETIQTTARILRRVLVALGHSNSSEKISANTDVKNCKRNK